MSHRPSPWLLLAIVAVLGVSGCDASGTTEGGALLTPDPCAEADGGHTFTDLYACYFGPGGKASCSAQGICHGSSQMTGSLTSGYICGTSREACWRGMTLGTSTCVDAGGSATDASAADALAEAQATEAGGADGGGGGLEAGASDGGAPEASAPTCTAGLPPIVPSGGASDPTTTLLWAALRGASGPGLHNMPYAAGAGGVSFTQADLDRISAWIQEGAQDN